MAAVEIIKASSEAAWLAERAKDVTSTESAALFGMSPYMTAFELYHRKRGGLQASFESNDRMAWGNRLEAAIAAGIAEENGWEIRPLKEYMRISGERIGSSFDFAILNLPDGPAHLEVKNVDYLAFKDGWLIHDDGTVEAPEHIEMQVQHQMMVSGWKRSFIGALIGGNRGIVLERQRDEATIAAIRARIATFWADVDAGREPPPVMPEDAEAVIRLNQYAQPGKILDASGDVEIAALVEEYKLFCAKRDENDEFAKTTKAYLLQAIGDAERVLLDGFTVSATMVADSPPTTITADMIGQQYGGRKGYRNMRVTAKKAKA